MQQFIDNLPYFFGLTVFIGMALLQWRIIGALDKALERQQVGSGSDVPIAPTQAPSPSAPVGKPAPALPPVQVPVPKSPDADAIISAGLIAFVKKQEGFSAHAYGDYKQYSIGYGTKATSADEVISMSDAETRLIAELHIAYNAVNKFIPNAPIGVKQGMTDATYNLGPVWENKELGALLAQGDYASAKSHLLQYNHAGGKVLDALTARREAECAMFDAAV